MFKIDTGCLLYHINTKVLYKDKKESSLLHQHFEFSNYPKNHELYNDELKKQVGILQDESVSRKFVLISGYVGPENCYSSKLYDPVEKCLTKI